MRTETIDTPGGFIRALGTERDPNGRDAHSPGAKLDAGKNRLGLVYGGFARALSEVGLVGTYGANKYTANGWVDVPDGISRYTDAMYRHLASEATGEHYDKDTGLRHAAHAAWNALARLDLMLRGVEQGAQPVAQNAAMQAEVEWQSMSHQERNQRMRAALDAMPIAKLQAGYPAFAKEVKDFYGLSTTEQECNGV